MWHVDECSVYSSRLLSLCEIKHELQLYCSKFIYVTFYYIVLNYVTYYIYCTVYLHLFKGISGNVKLEGSRLCQLDNSWGKPCEKD